jgi:esterase/lipase superfamily enzyme
MKREYHRWHSPSLGRDMELLAFGSGGARVLAFPTSQGRFYDWEDRGLVGALAGPLERGWFQLFCVDAVDAESWYNHRAPVADRVRRHAQYDRYLRDEVVPFIERVNETPFLIATGPSFGGYHAANFALRHPDAVQRLLSMSGLMDVGRFLHGHHDELCHQHNPCAFIAGEHEAGRLAALRRMDVILAVGRDDALRESNERLSRLLWERGIWHALRIWDGFAHDWPVWARMLGLYLGGHD